MTELLTVDTKSYIITYDETRFQSARIAFDSRAVYSNALSIEQSNFDDIHELYRSGQYEKEQYDIKVREFQQWQEINNPNKYIKLDHYDPNDLPQYYMNQLLTQEIENLKTRLTQLEQRR